MNNLIKWVLGLFKNFKIEEKKYEKTKTVGVVIVDKKEVKNNTIILNKDVYCVIIVITDDNKLVNFDFHLEKKLLTLYNKDKQYCNLKIEYIIAKK